MKAKFAESMALGSVAIFHRLFRVPVLDTPQIPAKVRARLRVDLLQEELDELKAAIDQGDLVEVADALADLQYVLAGTVHEFGMGKNFATIFEEVHRSNMSKACKSREEAEATVAHYAAEKHVEARIEQRDADWLVYRLADNKVLKSIRFSPPDIEGALYKGANDEDAPPQ
ncbi:hypothetical protein KFE25_000480 [Diacronema lutheri]|uniref:Phosphoribosyl-ATP pyrophosphohydrolase n=1 Tax=Diacronema lutheri TaxID=2081491 RepID=A0A8J5XVB1_DIALT|nr:hypothetical protein KFE25_000480 [Diacronema lutheri]